MVDPRGQNYLNNNNERIVINVAKFGFEKVKKNQIEEYKKIPKYSRKVIDEKDGWYRCRLCFSTCLKKVGENTGNLKKHMTKKHDDDLKALERIVLESSKEEVVEKCNQYILDLPPPDVGGGGMNRFVTRTKRKSKGSKQDKKALSTEAVAVAWFIDASIPFAQFDNDLFRKLCMTLGGYVFGSRRTVVESTLPALYAFIVKQIQEKMKEWQSFFVSYDGWSKHKRSFLSQTYHGISTTSFTYNHFLLDLIELRTEKWKESIAGALRYRQRYWTQYMEHLIVAGGVADGDSKMQGPGKLMFDEADMSRCTCHQIQLIWRSARSKGIVSQDLGALEGAIKFVLDNVNVFRSFKIHQLVNGLEDLNLVLANDTRWEGDYRCVERAIRMKESLPVLIEMTEVEAIAKQHKCDDFLSPNFFKRLEDYLVCMEPIYQATKLFQTQRFPTGCFVSLVVDHFLMFYGNKGFFVREDRDDTYLLQLRRQIKEGVDARLAPILSHSNDCDEGNCECEVDVFLKAALFHPGVWHYLVHLKRIDDRLQARTVDCAIEDALNTIEVPGEDAESQRETYREMFKSYFSTYLSTTNAMVFKKENDNKRGYDVNLKELSEAGTFWTVNHMDYWKAIATDQTNKMQINCLKSLITVAAMLLAVPSSEAFDEVAFSSSGKALTKERTALANHTLEQLTVIRMYVKDLGISINEFGEWVDSLAEQQDQVDEK